LFWSRPWQVKAEPCARAVDEGRVKNSKAATMTGMYIFII
jgi:hypothetical protein